jgi:hypothetical protein
MLINIICNMKYIKLLEIFKEREIRSKVQDISHNIVVLAIKFLKIHQVGKNFL